MKPAAARAATESPVAVGSIDRVTPSDQEQVYGGGEGENVEGALRSRS